MPTICRALQENGWLHQSCSSDTVLKTLPSDTHINKSARLDSQVSVPLLRDSGSPYTSLCLDVEAASPCENSEREHNPDVTTQPTLQRLRPSHPWWHRRILSHLASCPRFTYRTSDGLIITRATEVISHRRCCNYFFSAMKHVLLWV